MFDQDEQEFSQIIQTGLDLILSGQATLEQVLERYPDRAEAIRLELEAVVWLSSRSAEVAPRPGFVSASRRRVVDRIKQESASQGTKRAFMGIAWPKRLSFQWVLAALILLVLFSSTGGLVTFAQNTIPGDDLYAVKQVSESIAYSVAITDTRRVELSARFAERRLSEAAQLMEKGDYQAVAPAIEEYKQLMNRAIALVQRVSTVNSAQAAKLAANLKTQLVEQAVVVDTMQASAPVTLASVFADLKGAVEASLFAVDDLTDGIFDLSTATPTFTFTPSPSPDPVVTETPVPYPTSTLPSDPMDDEYPYFGDTISTDPSSEDEDATVTPDVKLTKTPKPTNVNRDKKPGLTDNPSTENKPDKPDKPDKTK